PGGRAQGWEEIAVVVHVEQRALQHVQARQADQAAVGADLQVDFPVRRLPPLQAHVGFAYVAVAVPGLVGGVEGLERIRARRGGQRNQERGNEQDDSHWTAIMETCCL